MKEELKSEDFGKYKNNQHYHQAYKLLLPEDIVSSQESLSFIERKHGVPTGSLSRIKREVLNELGYYRILEEMKKGSKDNPLTSEQEADQLRQALELATMKVAALETLIDVAEDRHNIAIRKKTGSRQSK